MQYVRIAMRQSGRMDMDTKGKIRENRLRRMAIRQGYIFRRSARRDPRAIDYGRYWLMKNDGKDIAFGGESGWTIDQIEDHLTW